jgi:hypothetical protein
VDCFDAFQVLQNGDQFQCNFFNLLCNTVPERGILFVGVDEILQVTLKAGD